MSPSLSFSHALGPHLLTLPCNALCLEVTFITANMLETAMMVFKRIALDPVKFRLIRLIKFRLKVQTAQRSGAPVPVNTPELEAIGLMSDMLSLMYRYSVDTLGAVIAPITIVVLYMFRQEFEVELWGA